MTPRGSLLQNHQVAIGAPRGAPVGGCGGRNHMSSTGKGGADGGALTFTGRASSFAGQRRPILFGFQRGCFPRQLGQLRIAAAAERIEMWSGPFAASQKPSLSLCARGFGSEEPE